MSFVAAPINPAASERELLVQLLLLVDTGFTDINERLTTMTQIATDTAAAVAAENTKVDALIAAIQPAIQSLRDALTAAQAQAATLQTQLSAVQADQAADATTLQTTLAAANDEAGKVQAALDALGTPTPPAAP